MGLNLARADTETLRGLTERLTAGRLFPSGRGFVPFVKGYLDNRLLVAGGPSDQPRPVVAASKPADATSAAGLGSGGKSGSDDPSGASKSPSDCAEIGIGLDRPARDRTEVRRKRDGRYRVNQISGRD